MNTLTVNLKNCYGIRNLEEIFDFEKSPVVLIYAPNGAMKSSFAQTFDDVSKGVASRDRVFQDRLTSREIFDENGDELDENSVFVMKPYENLSHNEKTSTLLVNSAMRKEYEELYASINEAKEVFLDLLSETSKSKRNVEREVSQCFTASDDDFLGALRRVHEEMQDEIDMRFADVDYDLIFQDKAIEFLKKKNFKETIKEFVERFNELLDQSTYFRRGTFNYYHANAIAKSLDDNGFFEANHSVNLNADESLEVKTRAELETLVQEEKDSISEDKELRKKFADIEKALNKNQELRSFTRYLTRRSLRPTSMLLRGRGVPGAWGDCSRA